MNRTGPVRRWLPTALTSAALLGWSNAVVPVLPPGPGGRAAANVAATTVLVAAARRGGMTWEELGLSRRNAASGARWGGAALAAVAAGYGQALAAPALRHVLAGAAPGAPSGAVFLRAAVLVPLGTVLCEELAFRGVLLALARRASSPRTAVVVVSAAFGLWHVRSARLPVGTAGSPTGGTAPVIGVVVLTTAGGLLFGWLRHRSGSLLAPMGLHLGTNGAGLVAAAAASRMTAG